MTTWKVRYIDYPSHYGKMRKELLETIDRTLSRGDVMLRQQLEDFETNFASFIGVKHAVGVSNCTDAMHLSLRAAGIGPGDEVITVSHTMVATAAAIHHAGATPVLVDIGEDHNMDVSCVEPAITPRTKAIMPVHLNGRVCDMGQLMSLANAYGLLVVEDAAQAIGASFHGTKAGAFGLAGCFSFYPAKLLGAFGDGGAVATNDGEIAEKITLLRNHGRKPDGEVAGWSFNCRLDNLHAAMLDVKLRQVPGWIARRREIARAYQDGLGHLTQVLLPPPPLDEGPYFDVYQNYEIEAERVDELRAHLTAQGVETMIPWGGKGVHQFQALGLTHYRLPRTESMFKGALMLPMHPDLSDEHVEYVIEAVRGFY
ncbi:MAG: DegT/DnrJ/EryC1/StrS family aminotransferase [Chloroflexi bacterium]|nr:DegT/DnrJ/EryC1/StrS family aminotransferase [Chloroflexota bacterium]